MASADTRAGYRARLVSPYIDTSGKCLELFYWIKEKPSDGDVETQLKVVSISEELTEVVLRTVSDLTVDFPRLFVPLPDGIHRIAVEGKRGESTKSSALSVDDLTIMDCSRFGKMKNEMIFQNHAAVTSLRCQFYVQRNVQLYCAHILPKQTFSGGSQPTFQKLVMYGSASERDSVFADTALIYHGTGHLHSSPWHRNVS